MSGNKSSHTSLSDFFTGQAAFMVMSISSFKIQVRWKANLHSFDLQCDKWMIRPSSPIVLCRSNFGAKEVKKHMPRAVVVVVVVASKARAFGVRKWVEVQFKSQIQL